jgi:hypothetical protein
MNFPEIFSTHAPMEANCPEIKKIAKTYPKFSARGPNMTFLDR